MKISSPESKKIAGEGKPFKDPSTEIEELYSRVIDLFPDSIVNVDRQGVIISCNNATLRMLGYSRDEIIGKHFTNLGTIRSEDVPKYLKLFRSVLTGKETEPLEFTLQRKDGTSVAADARVSLFKVGRKTVVQSITRDITVRKRMEMKLQEKNEELRTSEEELHLSNRMLAEANEELVKFNQRKSEFWANMSHELRTPLNAVLGFSELLLDRIPGEVNKEQEQCLKDILLSGQHLLQLINDVLDLSKIEAGKIEFRPAYFKLRDVIAMVESTTAALCSNKEHQLNIDVDEAISSIYADEGKVRQILLNLLSNAYRYTPRGGQITIQAVRVDDDCKISVSDSGIGIIKEDLKRIFDEFIQVDRSGAAGEGGTGLGLPIAKRFTQMHGGNIWAESEYGEGSTFNFVLPNSIKKMPESKARSEELKTYPKGD
ncbi:ATP-binding protein [Chloroflexota bacterium]